MKVGLQSVHSGYGSSTGSQLQSRSVPYRRRLLAPAWSRRQSPAVANPFSHVYTGYGAGSAANPLAYVRFAAWVAGSRAGGGWACCRSAWGFRSRACPGWGGTRSVFRLLESTGTVCYPCEDGVGDAATGLGCLTCHAGVHILVVIESWPSGKAVGGLPWRGNGERLSAVEKITPGRRASQAGRAWLPARRWSAPARRTAG